MAHIAQQGRSSFTQPHTVHRSSNSQRRHIRTCAFSPQPLQQRQQVARDSPIQLLKDWIAANGGYIHPALQLVDAAPVSGCRGIVAVQPITLEDLEAGPLISIPQDLQLTSRHALDLVQALSNSDAVAAAAQDQLEDTQLIAAALAHHCKQINSTHTKPAAASVNNSSSSSYCRTDRSFWVAYLLNLPAQAPNPWLLKDSNQVSAAIEPYARSRGPLAVAGWSQAVADYRQQMLTSAAEVEQLLGNVVQISADDIMTATAQVVSRSLTSSSSSGLVPFVDLLNHAAYARAPMLQLDDNDKLVITVLPIYHDEAVPLAAGQELLISYQGGYTPLEAFLKFGFVADEWWSES